MKKLLNVVKENKAFIFPWIVLIGLVILLTSGLTYAYFDYIDGDSGGGSSLRISATDFNVSLSITNVNLNSMMPIYDDYKDTQANAFNFSMSNTSRKLAGCVDLYLEITSISEELKNVDFKWELKNNTNNTTTTGNFANIIDDKLLLKENENIPINTTYSYTLKIWYKYQDKADQSFVLGTSLSSKLMSVAYGGACGTQNSTAYTTVGTTQFTAAKDGYYRIETYNVNGDYASGEIFLAINEKLYFSVSNTSGTPTSVKCFIDSATGLCGTQGSQNGNNSRIIYAKTDLANSFISGYAGVNAPVYVNSSSELSNNTIHPTGKFFLNGELEFATSNTTPKVVVTYLGKYKERDTKLDNVRYIKDCTNGSTTNTTNHWVEIQAIKNGANVAYKKTLSGSTTKALIVDGSIITTSYASGGTGNACVTVDLGRTYDLDEVAIWHYYANGRTYHENITSVSANNSAWTEIRNETLTGETAETPMGKRISAYKKSSKPIFYIYGTSSPREVRIGSEEFYVLNDVLNYSTLMSTNGNVYNYASNKTILLAKYNLYVGRIYDGSTYTEILSSASGYGLQNENAKAYADDSSNRVGVVPFTGSINANGYWYDGTSISPKYGISYNGSNVYDINYATAPNWDAAFDNNVGNANYSVAYYVEEYVNRLGIDGVGRLLTYTEANAMSQAKRTNGARYWLASAATATTVRNVSSTGTYNSYNFKSVNTCGVRPVIIVNTSDISE